MESHVESRKKDNIDDIIMDFKKKSRRWDKSHEDRFLQRLQIEC